MALQELFEKECGMLSEAELNSAPLIASILRCRIGRRMAIKNEALSDEIMNIRGEGFEPPRIRKIIGYIRRNAVVVGLMASSTGYYVAETAKELEDYEQSLLDRESAIRKIRESIAEQRRKYYSNEDRQLTLF